MLPLLGFHNIAAQRGDGLRPEFLRLLRRSRARPEGCRASASPGGDSSAAQPPPDPASVDTGSSHEGVPRLPASRG